MVDIPLISRVWKKKEAPQPSEEIDDEGLTEQDAKDVEESGYYRGLRDADMEEGISGQPLPDDAKYQFFGGNVFGQHTIEKADISRLILPSLSTSYHQKEITLAAEIPPFLSRVIYGEIDLCRIWSNRFKLNKDKFWFGDEAETKNIFEELEYFLLYKLDADNKTRLSYEMRGLKEVSTSRRDIERGERKPKVEERTGAKV